MALYQSADNETKQAKKENMFIQICWIYVRRRAKLLIAAKDKRLHQVYKGLSKDVVKDAFGWDDNFIYCRQRNIHENAWECFWNLKLDKLC